MFDLEIGLFAACMAAVLFLPRVSPWKTHPTLMAYGCNRMPVSYWQAVLLPFAVAVLLGRLTR